MSVAWKKIVTASGASGQLIGTDLTNILEDSGGNITAGTPPDNYVLTSGSAGKAQWQEPYLHPSAAEETLVVTGSTATNNKVIKSFGFSWASEADGHITASNSEATTYRDLNLNNFGYYGASNANMYTHPSVAAQTLAVSYTADSTQAEVMTSMEFGFQTDSQGHITAMNTSGQAASKDNIELTDLGYQGDLQADKYTHWKMVVDTGGAVDVTSEKTVAFEGGGNISLAFANDKLTIAGTAQELGEIEQVTAGNGIMIDGDPAGVGSGANPEIIISLQTPATAGNSATYSDDGLIGANDAEVGTDGGHSHAIAVTGDGAANPGEILAVPQSGTLIIQDLVTNGGLEVQGGHVYFDSVDVAFSDNVIQLNTSANGQTYQDRDSAIIFGNVNLADGGKITNTDSSFIVTDLHTDDAADLGGSVTLGNPKPIECQHIAVGEAYLGRAWVQNSLKVTGGAEISDYIKLNSNDDLSNTDAGVLRYNDGKLWVRI